jgi:hypothetical protein
MAELLREALEGGLVDLRRLDAETRAVAGKRQERDLRRLIGERVEVCGPEWRDRIPAATRQPWHAGDVEGLEYERADVGPADEYIQQARPRFVRAPSRFLFPNKSGGHKSSALLSQQIADLVERELGVRLAAHQVRHLAGFL